MQDDPSSSSAAARPVLQVKEVFSVLNEIQMQLDTVQVGESARCWATWRYLWTKHVILE